MALNLSAAVEKILNRASSAVKSFTQTNNMAMDSVATALDPLRVPLFVSGKVIRTGVGAYDFAVSVPSIGTLACVMLTSCANNTFGVSESSLPVEGSNVLVFVPSNRGHFGYIIGVIPAHDTMAQVDANRKANTQNFASFWELESGSSIGSASAYRIPYVDKTYPYKVNSGAGRPLDAMPGSYVLVNEQGVGIGITELAATIKGNSRSQIRVSPINDSVRVVAGFFQKYDAAGSTQTFNDGGYVTEERGVTSYQCERSGAKAIGIPIFNYPLEAIKTLSQNSLVTSWKGLKGRITGKKRLQTFTGFLGDIFNLFIANPDPNIDVETEDSKAVDQGLLQVHADTSGRLMIRSAAGITFQRYDRIPVPKRIAQPWDPAGRKVESAGFTPDNKVPFEQDTTYPYARALQLQDEMAWYWGQSYCRLDSVSLDNPADFYIPDELDLKVPDNKYDSPGDGVGTTEKYDKRQATIGIEEDGSIILRDAWGSEIILRGGNIVINCAGQIECHSGKSTVMMAGHDLVLKGRESVDITATEKDMRLKADGNLHMLAEGRNGGGGILLESNSTSSSEAWKGVQGEDVKSTGIILKAPKSTVFATADTVHLSGTSSSTQHPAVVIETFDDNKQNNGDILIAANRIFQVAKTAVEIQTGDKVALILGTNNAALYGKTVAVVGSSTPNSVGIFRGAQSAELYWGEIIPKTDVYATKAVDLKQFNDKVQKTDWLIPFDPDNRKNYSFTYRNMQQYGTLSATEIYGADKFYVYQPYWAYMANNSSSFVPVTVEKWAEYAIGGTKAWPGCTDKKDNPGPDAYVTLHRSENTEDDSGLSIKRKDLVANGGDLVLKSFDEYEVVSHN